MRVMRIFYILLTIFLCNCQDKSVEPTDLPNTISFTPANLVSPSGESIEIFLNMIELKESIFAISFHIDYDNSDVIKDDATIISHGGLFGQDAVYFVKDISEKIYVSITLIKGNKMVSGAGSLCSLQFSNPSKGECNLSIDLLTIYCYNSNGNLIDIDLRANEAKISVQ